MLLLLVGGLVFVALGALIAGLVGDPIKPGAEWVGWVGMIFFGACVVAIVPQLLDREESLRISSLGLLSRKWSDETIPWSEITAVTVWTYRGNRSIILHLRDAARFPSATLLGRLAGANRALTGGDVAISLTGMDRTTDQALAEISRWIPDKVHL